MDIPYQDKGDEIGEMAGAVQVFKENMIENDRLASEKAAEQEDKQSRIEAREARTRDLNPPSPLR